MSQNSNALEESQILKRLIDRKTLGEVMRDTSNGNCDVCINKLQEKRSPSYQ